MKSFGFEQSIDEPCVYKLVHEGKVVFLVLYVDDILLIGNDVGKLSEVRVWLAKQFDMEVSLSKDQSPKTAQEIEDMRKIPYASAVGSLMYDMPCTRPDICFAIGVVSRFQSNPGPEHWIADKHVLKYL